MEDKIKLSSKKIKTEKKLKKIFRIALLIFLFLFILLYLVIGIIYNSGNFSITLDKNLYFSRGIIIYDDPNYKVYQAELSVASPKTFTNISGNWLPDNLDDSTGGSHNGSEYLAYTFFVENVGAEITSYWSELFITDVIKKIDSAVRIRVYRNGQPVTYAKKASNGRNEPDTIPFEEEKLVARNKVDNFKPGDIDKYTIVIWVEGSDPECTDDILGGEFSVYMDFNSEYVEN